MKSRNARKNVTTNVKRLLGIAAAGAITLLMKQQSASAAPFTYQGATGSSWGLGTNWVGNNAPTDGADIVFSSTGTIASVNATTSGNYLTSVGSITFNAGTGADTISASTASQALTITGAGITNTSSKLQTISEVLAIASGDTATIYAGNVAANGLFLSATSSFIVGTSSNLIFNGLTTANLSMAGAFVLGSGSTLTKNGVDVASIAGATTLQGGNTLSVSAGTLNLAGGFTEAGGSTITVASGASLVSGTSSAIGNGTSIISGGVTSLNGGVFTLGTNNTVTVNGGTTNIGNNTSSGIVGTVSNINVSSGTLNWNGALNLSLGSSLAEGGTLTSVGGATNLLGNNLLSVSAGKLSLAAGFSEAGGSTITVASGASLVSGTSSAIGNGTAIISGGTTSLAGGSFTFGTNNTVTVNGGVTNVGITTSGVVVGTVSNINVSSGTLNWDGGLNLSLGSSLTEGGTLTSVQGATNLLGNNLLSVSAGKLSLTAGFTEAGGSTITVASGASLVSGTSSAIGNGTAIISGGVTSLNGGVFTLGTNNTVTVNGGTTLIGNATSSGIVGTVSNINVSSGTLNWDGTMNLSLGSSIAEGGLLTSIQGATNLLGQNLLSVSAGTLNLVSTATALSSGNTVSVAGGSLLGTSFVGSSGDIITVDSPGTFKLSGSLTTGVNTTLKSSGITSFVGTTLGAGNTVSVGGGTLVLAAGASSQASINGTAISVSGGLLSLGGATTGGFKDLGTGSSITVSGGSFVSGSNALSTSLGANGNINVGSAGNFILNNGTVLTAGAGLTFLSAGTTSINSINLGSVSTISVSGGTFSLGGAVMSGSLNTLSVSGGIASFSGMNANAGGVGLSANRLIVSGGAVTYSGTNANGLGLASVSGGTLTFGGGNGAIYTGGTLNVGDTTSGNSHASTVNFGTGTYSMGTTNIQAGSSGLLELINPSTNSGGVVVSGTMNVNNNFTVLNQATGSPVTNISAAFGGAGMSASTLMFDSQGNINSTLALSNTASPFLGTISVKGGMLAMGATTQSPQSIWLGTNSTLQGSGNVTFSTATSISLAGPGITMNEAASTKYTVNSVISEASANTGLTLLVGLPNQGPNGTPQITLANTNTYTGTTTIEGAAAAQIWGSFNGNNGQGVLVLATAANALGGGAGGTGGAVSFVNPQAGATIYTPFQENTINLVLSANQQVKGLDNSTALGDLGAIVGNTSANVVLALNSPVSASGSNLYSYSGLIGKSGTYTGLGSTSTLRTVTVGSGVEPTGQAAAIGVVVTGSGTQRLTGIQSNYTGATSIGGSATLQISDGRNLGSTSGVTLDGGTLETSTGVSYTMTTPILNVSNAEFLSSVIPTLGGTGSLPGVYAGGNVASVSVISGGSGYTSAPTVSPSTILSYRNLTVAGDNLGGSYSAVISGGQVTAVNVIRGGDFLSSIPALQISAGNTTSAFAVSTMNISDIVQLSSGFGVTNATITVDGQAETANVTNPTIASAVILTSNGGTLMQDAGSSLSITGTLSGTNSAEVLNKSGGGTLFLSNSTSSILGTFNMQGGVTSLSAAKTNIAFASTSKIIVGDTQANSGATFDVTVSTASYVFNSGQSVSGYGTLVGTNAVVASGATLNPGTASTSGSLAVTGNLSVAGGANLLYNMGGSSTSTTTNVSSLFTLGASTASKVNLTVSNVTAGVYSLFTFGSYSGPSATTLSTNVSPGYFTVTGVPGIDTYSVVQSANDIELQVAGAPQIAEHVSTNTTGRGNAGTIALQSNSSVNYYGRTDVNGGTGATKGVITVDRSALGSPYTFNSPQIFLFQFESDSNSANNPTGFHYGGTAGVNGSPTTDGNQVADAAALSALEADLSAAGYTFVDYAGHNDPTATNTGGGGGTAANDAALAQALSLNSQYDLAIELEGPQTGIASYMDFDFSSYNAGSGISVFNVAAVPEPGSLSLVALSAMGLLGRRRSRKSRKGKMEAGTV